MSFSYKNISSVEGGAAKDPVADFASLPLSGNTDGDLRVTLDTHTLYVWNQGTNSWDVVTGSSTNSFTTINTPSGTDPVADSSSDTLNLSSSDSNIVITGNSATDTVDFALSNTISGDKSFTGTVSIGDMQILPTQSAILLDNQASAANLFSYSTTYESAVVEYLLKRDGEVRQGTANVYNDGTSAFMTEIFGDSTDIGVTLSATVSGANVVVQYTTSNTGINASIKYNVRRWF